MALRTDRTFTLSSLRLLGLAILIGSGSPFSSAQELAQPDSARFQVPDSLRPPGYKSRFIAFVGNIAGIPDSTSRLHSTRFIQSDAASLSDLLRWMPGTYSRELGQPGQPSELSVRGMTGTNLGLLLDGRPLRDPVTGTYPLADIPIEYVDLVETADGPASLFASPNSGGGTFNLVSHQYDNVRPTTKLRFLQGPYNHILTDGLFAQNLTRGLNAMVGVQRLVTDGRYPNSQYDSWNVRSRFRLNITDRINLWASDFYTRSTTGLNGGIDPLRSPSLFDEVTAVVRDETGTLSAARHDFTMGFLGLLLPDTTSRTKALAYYSFMHRDYSTGGSQSTFSSVSDIQRSAFVGAKLEQRLNFNSLHIDLGADIERREVDKGRFLPSVAETYSSLEGRGSIHATDWFALEGSARKEQFRGDNSLSWSFRVQTNPLEGFILRGGLERTNRYPSILEMYWTDSSLSRSRLPGRERHTVVDMSIDMKSDFFSISLGGFKRAVDDAIVVTQLGSLDSGVNRLLMIFPKVTLQGLTAALSFRIWRLTAAGNVTYNDYHQDSFSTQPFPRFSAFGELSYDETFGNHGVDLSLGARVRANSHHYGLQFIPQEQTFVQQNSSLTPGYSILDLFAVARIGDAHVMLVWENPLNVNAMTSPYYPLLDRNIKLGVNWVFTD